MKLYQKNPIKSIRGNIRDKEEIFNRKYDFIVFAIVCYASDLHGIKRAEKQTF